jgi:ATPase family associated with various cellular activities (AAA)
VTAVRNPFTELAHTPESHFTLSFYGAVLHLRERLPDLGRDAFPFLAGYDEELVAGGATDAAGWAAGVEAWEGRSPTELPLRRLGISPLELTLFFTAGLAEEDARFGGVWEVVQGARGAHRPTLGLLTGWWSPPERRADVRAALRRLLDAGLLEATNPDAPRPEWTLQPPSLVWDAAHGDLAGAVAPWAVHRRADELPPADELIVSAETARALATVPALLDAGRARALVVRGPAASGRRTLVGAVARATGRGLLEVTGLDLPDDPRWRFVGPLATLLHALPVTAVELAPGESVQLPRLGSCAPPFTLALGRAGGVDGPGAETAATLSLELPDAAARERHWAAELGDCALTAALAARYRMTGGNIRRVAQLARAQASLADRDVVTVGDVRAAHRALHSRALDTLADRVEVAGSWDDFAACDETMRELQLLEARCRHRERLQEPARGSGGAGVRALFSGPSGTGKTLAARLLASTLGLDLYRLDLSTVVNKYLGETEKNLSRVFARAEELGVILLLDEGDALLTRRTDVHTSNDRYANLETNYLLQRLESFEGILIVTTNAGDRIDDAFERRMDVVVEFRLPDASERWTVWELHLPPQHAVEPVALQHIAGRCALTGGQIRNAVLHATLLALEDGRTLERAHVEDAVRREYRKAGEVCPLR